MYLSPPSSYSNKTSWNRVLSSFPDPAIHPIASAKPHRLLLENPQSFLSTKILSTLWKCVGCVWVQISSQDMSMREGRRKGYNDFSLRMSSSLSKRRVCVCCRKLIESFSLWMTSLHLWITKVYIVWLKSKEVTFKNPPGRMFRDCLAGKPYSRDTLENNSLARLFSFQSCAPHVALSRLSFSRNPLILHLSLSLHQLNTKPNTIKSHKIQGTK